ncbi:hypothetical protein JYB87_15585 [Shewanella avicenniae]|uniref:Uncharacterized protein n=1 Tax=Shewanella avicenniae TaxID=2814294 RepID=A0ABX7QP27_9GAMM|nr:hypothetical protein [Shewanella avicenniae]QSX33129.1 hypothetical protein JYB87_15585 [Shewanella avicenniae]
MKKRILSILLVLLFPLSTYAVVFGGSNLGFRGYPSHSCSKPTKPFKPYSFNSQWEIDSYNSDVELYNSQLQQYLSCIDEYIENANNDIKRIKEKGQAAIDEANY